MDKEELTKRGPPKAGKRNPAPPGPKNPPPPKEAIVRLVLKGTVVNLEIKKPVGKWEKVFGASYSKIVPDEETGFPRGLGLDTISGLAFLMEDNKNRAVFAKFTGS